MRTLRRFRVLIATSTCGKVNHEFEPPASSSPTLLCLSSGDAPDIGISQNRDGDTSEEGEEEALIVSRLEIRALKPRGVFHGGRSRAVLRVGGTVLLKRPNSKFGT